MDPYDWQRRAAARVEIENTLVVVETGAGKTLVACLAIESALRRSPHGKIAFIVPVSRLLAHQQFERIRDYLGCAMGNEVRHLVVEVTGYTAGSWVGRDWETCCTRHSVFVGTADLFLHAFVDHGFLALREFTLIVIDECHHVGEANATLEILNRLHCDISTKERRPSARTRVLGLTATLTKKKATTRAHFEKQRKQLIDAMQAHIETCDGILHRAPPEFKKLEVGRQPSKEASLYACELCSQIWELIKRRSVQKCNEDTFRKVTDSLALVLLELGKDAFAWALEYSVIAQIEGKIDNMQSMVHSQDDADALKADLPVFRESLRSALEFVNGQLLACTNADLKSKSEKVEHLFNMLDKDFGHQLQDGSFCGMVFVQEVALATPLAWLLSQMLHTKVEVASGTNSMKEQVRNEAFHRFRTGRSRLLVCTSCAEEGVDVAACGIVVRFSSFSTTRSHVQGAGRARLPKAVIYYMENDPIVECDRAALMWEVVNDSTLPGPSVEWPSDSPAYLRVIDRKHPFVVPHTGSEINVENAKRMFAKYIAQVTHGRAAIKASEKPGVVCVRVGCESYAGPGLILPGPNGSRLLSETALQKFWEGHSPPASENCLFYVAMLVLRFLCWLDDHNRATPYVLKNVVWPVPTESIPILLLRNGWYPLGVLGAKDLIEAALPKKLATQDSDRDRCSSGVEQKHIGFLKLSPACIHNTQKTVNKTYSDGRSVLDTMVSLARGHLRIDELPKIKVSLHPETKKWYAADNRRCFTFKVVAPILQLKHVEVNISNWTSEFNSKLHQAPRMSDTWTTDDCTVEQVRHELMQLLGNAGPIENISSPLQACVTDDVLRNAESIMETVRNMPSHVLPSIPVGHLQESAARFPYQVPVPSGSSANDRTSLFESSVDATICTTVGQTRNSTSSASSSTDRVARSLDNLLTGKSANLHCPNVSPPPKRLACGSIRSDAPSLFAPAPERLPGTYTDILQKVSHSLAAKAKGAPVSSCLELVTDPISVINLAVMGHYKPHEGEQLPIEYKPFEMTDAEGFVVRMLVCGHEAIGAPCKNSKLAKKSAALAMVKSLVGMATVELHT